MYYTTSEYLRIVANAISRRGVKVVEGDHWMADTEDGVLYYNPKDLLHSNPAVAKGLLLHESTHIEITKSPKNYTKDKVSEAKRNLHNAFEDFRVDLFAGRKFNFFSSLAISAMNQYVIDYGYNQTGGDLTKHPKYIQFLLYISLTLYENFQFRIDGGELCTHLSNCQYGWKVEDEVMERLRNNKNLIYNTISKVRNQNDFSSVISITDKNIYPIIKDWIEEEEQKEDSKGSGDGEGEDGGGDGIGEGAGGLFANGSLSPSPSDVEEGLFKSSKGMGKGDLNKYTSLNYKETSALLRPETRTLATKLTRILNDSKAVHYRGAKLTGKLLSKNAYKVSIPNENRIFSRRTINDVPYYHLYMAIDRSGSMYQEREKNAFIAAVIFNDVAQRLRFPVKIYQFDEYMHEIDSLEDYLHADGGTDDSSTIKEIRRNIDTKANNLVVFITDGETYKRMDREEDLKFVKKHSLFIPIGIGDMDFESLKESYQTKDIIGLENPDTLPDVVAKIVDQLVKRETL